MADYTIQPDSYERIGQTDTSGAIFQIEADTDLRLVTDQPQYADDGQVIPVGYVVKAAIPPDEEVYLHNPADNTSNVTVTEGRAVDLPDGSAPDLTFFGPRNVDIQTSDTLSTDVSDRATRALGEVSVLDTGGSVIDPRDVIDRATRALGEVSVLDTGGSVIDPRDVIDRAGRELGQVSILNTTGDQIDPVSRTHLSHAYTAATGTGTAGAAEVTTDGVDTPAAGSTQWAVCVDTSGPATVTIEAQDPRPSVTAAWYTYDSVSIDSATTEVILFDLPVPNARARIDQNLNDLVLSTRGT